MKTVTGKIIGIFNNEIWSYVREVVHHDINIKLTVSDLVEDVTEATIFVDMEKVKEYLTMNKNMKVFDTTLSIDLDTQQVTEDLR